MNTRDWSSGEARFLKLLALAFAMGILALCFGFLGSAMGWRWLRIASLGLGGVGLGIGVVAVLIRLAELIGCILKGRT